MKEFYRLLIETQIASDSGKYSCSTESILGMNAVFGGYPLKEENICKILFYKPKDVRAKIVLSDCESVIYFEGLLNDFEWQVSFHLVNDDIVNELCSFDNIEFFQYCSNEDNVDFHWNEWKYGSSYCCRMLSHKYFPNEFFYSDEDFRE